MASIKTQSDIITPIIKWIKTIHPELLVIIDRPGKQRPPRPYMTVRMLTPVQKLGSTDNLTHISDSKWCQSGQRMFVISIVAYEKGEREDVFEAQDRLIRIQDSVEDPNLKGALEEAGLAVWQTDDILDTTELLETGYEPRAQLDITMGIASNRTIDLGAIEEVRITPKIDGVECPEQTIK